MQNQTDTTMTKTDTKDVNYTRVSPNNIGTKGF